MNNYLFHLSSGLVSSLEGVAVYRVVVLFVFQGFKIFFFVLGGIYLLYLVYLLIRAYAELRQMPYFGTLK
jgi:hypothetical protein